MKAVIVVCGLLMLGGCATGGQSNPPWMAMGGSCTKLSGDQELSLNLADDMAKEGKLHASLANLQNLPQGSAQVQLRKARIYRQLAAMRPGRCIKGCWGRAWQPKGSMAWANWQPGTVTTPWRSPIWSVRHKWRRPMPRSAMTWVWFISINGGLMKRGSSF